GTASRRRFPDETFLMTEVIRICGLTQPVGAEGKRSCCRWRNDGFSVHTSLNLLQWVVLATVAKVHVANMANAVRKTQGKDRNRAARRNAYKCASRRFVRRMATAAAHFDRATFRKVRHEHQ